MIRRHVAATGAVIALLVAAAPFAIAATSTTPSVPAGDTYVSNPTEDKQITGYCADQAQLANNLERRNDHDRALQVVAAANMRGCRIYTFHTSWDGG
ncbi:hypothetical protein GCM10023094_46480 [Rhodococcus olei]|uniref:Uncharacterized protein n=1 Tax=Rhodococcus olei TaxID=2161675 RepID=A0ABP8PIZ2_9NOCA